MRVTFFLFLLSGMLLADNKGSEVPVFENALPGVRYVGSEVCAGCHSDVYRSFKKTDMGRSMAVLTASGKAPASQLSLAPTVVTVHSEKLHREFQVFTKGNELFQSEYELAPDGSEVFRDTQKLEYAVGALENAYTYIVKRGGFLYEAPLSYYKSLQAWDLSPGYADVDAGFSRPIATACAACHSGQPRPEKQPPGRFRDPPFTEVAIGCENCHGPGQLHVQARSTGKLMPAGYDRTIVNPQKLPPWLANNICMNCHEAGQSRIMHPGKEATSYRPGTPLDSVVSLFTLAAKQESAGKTDVLSHYQGMTASKCYRASGEKLQCITCHDPHVQSQNEASVYKSKCLSCHQENSCTLPVKSRQATVPADNCVGCHMGKKGVATIPHSALTDHRIVRTPDEALPPPVDDGFTKATGLVHLNAVPGETASESDRSASLCRTRGKLPPGGSEVAAIAAKSHTDASAGPMGSCASR